MPGEGDEGLPTKHSWDEKIGWYHMLVRLCWWECKQDIWRTIWPLLPPTVHPLMSQRAWTVTTKHHRLGGRDNRQLFLAILEAGKSEFKVP